MTTGSKPTSSHTDRRELKEIIKEFLSHYQYLHEKRIHKLLFYSEIYTLQHYSERISAADFKPYDYGPYADLIRDVLAEMEQDNEITINYNQQMRFKSNTGGDLSDDKQALITTIHEETHSMRTKELVKFAKSTPLWRTHNYNEEIDFEQYLTNAVLTTELREDLADIERTPANNEDVEALLT